MAENGETGSPRGTRTKTFPLNSRRLTASVIGRIARELGLQIAASLEDTRQVVDGKLEEIGKQSQNVRVELRESERGVAITLRDEEGVVLECQPEEESGDGADVETEEGGGEGGGAREESEGGGSRAEAYRRAELEAEVSRLEDVNAGLNVEVGELRTKVDEEKKRYRVLWRESCEQLAEYDVIVEEKDTEIRALKARIEELEAGTHLPEPTVHGGSLAVRGPVCSPTTHSRPALAATTRPATVRHGKAPPIDPFDGENVDVRFDDWLPMLQRAATWNDWSEEETLIQLAGHLRKRAFQEWNLLSSGNRQTLEAATTTLRDRLDPGSRAMAAQDFRHARQKETESASDFILRLERIFRSAYGRDNISSETRDTLLHGQLQEGLLYELMKAPAVSGA